MLLFATRKPRRFHHPYIYVDERKERLERMAGNARRELGLDAGEPFDPEAVRGKLAGNACHRKRDRQGVRRPWSWAALLMLIGLLMALWYVLDRGLT